MLIIVDVSVANAKQGFRYISVSREQGQVWATSGAGIICRRIGITRENPAGTGWVTGIGVSENSEKFRAGLRWTLEERIKYKL